MEFQVPELPNEINDVNINGNLFYNCDCISGSRRFIPDNSVDLIITDPPYGINGDKLHQHYNRIEDFVVDGYVEIPAAEYGDFSTKWIREAERILKPGGSIYIVSGYTNLYHILHALRETSLEEVNHIIWKYNFGVFTKRKFVSSHYHILFYQKPKGRRKFNVESRFGLIEKAESNGSLNYLDREDVWIINREYKPGQEKNKNELPTTLLNKMIQYSSEEGDLVCDLFLGGFSTARAAIGLNRQMIGFEISSKIFQKRVEDIKTLETGFLLPSLRIPTIEPIDNQGKAWTKEEEIELIREFNRLRAHGEKKGVVVEKLGKKFGRGRWSIEKALKKIPPSKISKSKNQEIFDFE